MIAKYGEEWRREVGPAFLTSMDFMLGRRISDVAKNHEEYINAIKELNKTGKYSLNTNNGRIYSISKAMLIELPGKYDVVVEAEVAKEVNERRKPKIGDIVVRTSIHAQYKQGHMHEIVSTSKSLPYDACWSKTHSMHPSRYRFATSEEAKAFRNGITNVDDMPKAKLEPRLPLKGDIIVRLEAHDKYPVGHIHQVVHSSPSWPESAYYAESKVMPPGRYRFATDEEIFHYLKKGIININHIKKDEIPRKTEEVRRPEGGTAVRIQRPKGKIASGSRPDGNPTRAYVKEATFGRSKRLYGIVAYGNN